MDIDLTQQTQKVQVLTVQHTNKIYVATIVKVVKTKFPFNTQSYFPL